MPGTIVSSKIVDDKSPVLYGYDDNLVVICRGWSILWR